MEILMDIIGYKHKKHYFLSECDNIQLIEFKFIYKMSTN